MAMKNLTAGHWWIENLLRPVLLAAMMVCLATPAVRLIELITDDWNGTYFLVFAFLAGLEGILSERVLQKQRIAGWAYLGSRATEALILLLLLKLASYIPLGLERLWQDALAWPSEPGRFLTDNDALTGMLFLALWGGALCVARQASELDVEEGKVAPPPDKSSAEYYLWLTQPSPLRDRERALQWLGESFLWGGVVLLLAATGIELINAAAQRQGLPPVIPLIELAAPTLIYFALGIALLSQARFSVTLLGWQIQGIPVQAGVARRWLLWTAIFLVGVALVALLLPTKPGMGPIYALYSLVIIVAEVVMMIITFIVYLFALLLSFLLPSYETPKPPQLEISTFPPAEPTSAAGSTPWLQVLLSALFWAVILTIVGYALVRFLQERSGLFAVGEGAELTWWGRLLAWLRGLWRQWRGWQQQVQHRLARRRAGQKDKGLIAAAASRFFSLRRLSPRELVHYFYLSTARRAAEAGQPRKPGQTPYEYQASMDGQFPDLEPDLTGLTEAFVRARYSQRPVEREDAEAVKPFWQRIKTALQRYRAKIQRTDDS